MSNSDLFSKEALEKLRSPEKLNSMLCITTPVSWMILFSVCLLVFAIVLWSIFGALSVKVEGTGIIMDSGSVSTVSHISSGKISEVYVYTGMRVKEGDLIAKMEQPSQSADTMMTAYDINLSTHNYDALNKAAQYDAKKYQKEINENIYSDYDGIVSEVMVARGSVVSSGAPICTIRKDQDRKDLIGVFYAPIDKGKQIKPGMALQLAPDGVDTTQTGSLIGIVRAVSQYPITQERMNFILGNSQLTQWMSSTGNGAVIEVQFDLIKDDESPSGYLWTSIVGEQPTITPGSVCSGDVIVDRNPPIEKVFYKISQWLRSR